MPTKAQHVLGEGGIFYVTKKIMKETSMQNDEHGPVDASRLCFVGWFSVIPWFSALTSLHLSLVISPFLCYSPLPCLFLCLTRLCLVRPSCPRPPRLHQKWQSQPPG